MRINTNASIAQRATSLQASIEVQQEVGGHPQNRSLSIIFEKPNEFRIVSKEGADATEVLTNGQFLYVTSSKDHPSQYLKVSAPPGDEAIRRALGHAGISGHSVLPALLLGKDPLADIEPYLTSVTFGKPETIEGQPVDTVIAAYKGAIGEGTITFSIGKKDARLYRVAARRTLGERTVTYTETYTQWKLGAPVSENAFAFTPPPDAQEVTSFETWLTNAGATLPPARAPRQRRPGRRPMPQTAPAGGAAASPPAGPAASAEAAPPETAQKERFDCGTVSLLDRARIEHTFVLRNAGTAPLALRRVEASCGCTTALVGPTAQAVVAGDSPETALPTLAPGESTPVRVTLDLAQLPGGSFHKPVSVYAQGRTAPVATFEMTGTLAPAVAFSAPVMDFGQVPAGKAPAQTLTVTLDPRLTASGAPALQTDSPYVRIVPSPDTAAPAPGKPVVRTYTVTIAPDAPWGPVHGRIGFALEKQDATAAETDAVTAALRSAAVPVFGTVTGDVAADPLAVAFGTVPQDRASVRQLVLVADRAESLKGIRFQGDQPWLSARLATEGAPAPGGTPSSVRRIVDVTLSAGAPAGALRGQLRITLAGGGYLLVPVTAFAIVAESRPTKAGK